jgi:hypothetical protein
MLVYTVMLLFEFMVFAKFYVVLTFILFICQYGLHFVSVLYFLKFDWFFLRQDVSCFGEDTCFSLAFGVPAALV